MGRQGNRKRKPEQHLPKVQGNPGKLWGDEPTPWVIGGDSAQQWVGRVGPSAQAAYFRRHPRAVIGVRVVGIAAAVAALAATIAIVIR